jgi:hypothetical protein
MNHYTPILASFFGIEYLIAYAIIAAISIGAGLLLRRKSGQAAMDQQAEQPSNQTARGGFVPIVMGRRRVGSCFLWTGDRVEIEEVVGTVPGGKFGGGGEQQIKQLVYLEKGWIALCCQRALIVHGIYKDGRLMENSRFAKPFMPSGSRIDFGKDGSGLIFWGEDHPQENEALTYINDLTGISSLWQNIVWMYYDRLRLGTVARWGNMEYDIETCPPSGLIGFSASATIGADNDKGWNPALCLLVLLMEESPLGCAIPNCRIDFLSFNTVGQDLVTEGLGANILVQDGQTAENVVAGILEDIGAMLYEVDGKIGIRLIRKVDSPIQISDSVMLPPYEEIDRFHRITQTDQVVFTYANINREFAPDIVNIEDDGLSEGGTRRRQRRVPLTIATNETVAWKIANRRLQENFAPFAKYGIKFIRDFKLMLPGDVVSHPTLGDLRLIETRFDATTPTTDALFVQDVYGLAPNYTDPDDGGGGGTTESPLPDILFRMFEVPRTMCQRFNYTGTLSVFSMLRVRKRNSVARAGLYRGATSLDLTLVTSTTKRQFGGFLKRTMVSDYRYDDDSLIIDIFGSAFANLTDDDKRKHANDLAAFVPSTTTSSWFGGGITIIIGSSGNEEVCYAKQIEPYETAVFNKEGVPQTKVISYKVRGLIRARHQTKAATHYAGASVYVFQANLNTQQPLVVLGTIGQGLYAYHKSRAYNANGTATTLLSSPNSNIVVRGKWAKAIPVQFVRYGEKVPAYSFRLGSNPPSWVYEMPVFRALRSTHTYAAKNVSGTPKPVAAIAIEMTYPSNTYASGAGGRAYSDGASSGSTAALGRQKTKDRFVLEVCFVPWEGTARGAAVVVRSQIVADYLIGDPDGTMRNHARYYGSVTIDYSAKMHQEDRAAVRQYLNNFGGAVNRALAIGDSANGMTGESDPMIGDVGDETVVVEGNTVNTYPPIFYIRIAHYLLDSAPEGIPASVRYYYSYDSAIRHEWRKVKYDEFDFDGVTSTWHNADYPFTGFDGGQF